MRFVLDHRSWRCSVWLIDPKQMLKGGSLWEASLVGGWPGGWSMEGEMLKEEETGLQKSQEKRRQEEKWFFLKTKGKTRGERERRKVRVRHTQKSKTIKRIKEEGREGGRGWGRQASALRPRGYTSLCRLPRGAHCPFRILTYFEHAGKTWLVFILKSYGLYCV